MTHTMEALRWKDDFHWRELQLSVSYTSYPENIPLVLRIYLEGLEQDASKVSDRIFSGCTEITLGGVRTAAEAHIRGSLYHCSTPVGIYIYTYIYTNGDFLIQHRCGKIHS